MNVKSVNDECESGLLMQRDDMEDREMILKIGGEGGGLTLWGKQTETGWIFSRNVTDQSTTLFGEDEITHTSSSVSSWGDAIALLDKYKWHRLYPLVAHQAFHKLILDAVIVRFKSEKNPRSRHIEHWRSLCST